LQEKPEEVFHDYRDLLICTAAARGRNRAVSTALLPSASRNRIAGELALLVVGDINRLMHRKRQTTWYRPGFTSPKLASTCSEAAIQTSC
jgi:hypothetical protein